MIVERTTTQHAAAPRRKGCSPNNRLRSSTVSACWACPIQLTVRLAPARVADFAHLACLGAACVPVALQVSKLVDPEPFMAIVAATALAMMVVCAYSLFASVRFFLTLSVALPVVGIVYFAFGVPVATSGSAATSSVVTSDTPVVVLVSMSCH